MDTTAVLSTAAAAITIGVSAVAARHWLGDYIHFVPRQDPSRPVKRTLSVLDVEAGIDVLVAYANEFDPDYVYGINRGGGIVGSWIAKKIGLPFIHLCAVNCDYSLAHRVMEDGPESIPLGSKILLVDDAKRKGEHMREALVYLRRKFPHAEIRRVVMLEMHIPNPGPESDRYKQPPAECAAFKTFDARVLLPWDDPKIGIRRRAEGESDAA